MSEQTSEPTPLDRRLRNAAILCGALAIAITLFFSSQAESASTSLDTQARASTPLEVATRNDKPTLLEFYANWCTTCQRMAGDLASLKSEYADAANFVMLNVDNDKWLPELLEYRVDGIPHFVYLDASGTPVAQAIGEQPRPILAENLDALIASRPLPHARDRGSTSPLDAAAVPNAGSADPRSHGAQVQ